MSSQSFRRSKWVREKLEEGDPPRAVGKGGVQKPACLPACLALGVHFSARVWSLSIPLPHRETGWLPSPKSVICGPTSHSVPGVPSLRKHQKLPARAHGSGSPLRTRGPFPHPTILLAILLHSMLLGRCILPFRPPRRSQRSLEPLTRTPWLKCPRRKWSGEWGGG